MDQDKVCTELRRKLDELEASGAGGTFRQTNPDGTGIWENVTPGYMTALYELRDACRARIGAIL